MVEEDLKQSEPGQNKDIWQEMELKRERRPTTKCGSVNSSYTHVAYEESKFSAPD